MSDDLAGDVLAQSRLTRGQRARIHDELRAHIDDALASGKTIDEIRSSLGDADTLAVALELSPPPVRRSRALSTALVATAATLAWYVATAVRLGSFTTHSVPNAMLDSTASIARQWIAADSSLDHAHVDSAMSIASRLASNSSAFARVASIDIARRAAIAAEPCTLIHRRAVVLASAPLPDLTQWYTGMVMQLDGPVIGRGLRVFQAMKGVRSPSLSARLLEPLFFATAASPTDVMPRRNAERHTEPSRCAVPSTLNP